MFGIGDTEFLLILLFAFLLFGPDKLPAMGRTLGRAIKQFKSAQQSVTKVVQDEVITPVQKAASSVADPDTTGTPNSDGTTAKAPKESFSAQLQAAKEGAEATEKKPDAKKPTYTAAELYGVDVTTDDTEKS